MAEAVKIKEGGVDRSQNQIEKLKTNMQGGGVCYWVPETERQTDDKRITENGTYTAEEEGLYGYDEIVVSVPNTGNMSGKGADGNDYSVTVDDNGYIVETKIPSAIQITTPPPRVSYNDGETIDYSGIVVTLYDGNGNVFTDSRYTDGTVPFSELVFPVDKAHYEGGGGASSDLDTSPVPQPIQYVDGAFLSQGRYRSSGKEYVYTYEYTPLAGVTSRVMFWRIDEEDELIRTLWSSDTLGVIGTMHYRRWRDGELVDDSFFNIETDYPAEIHSKTAYYGERASVGSYSYIEVFPYTIYIKPINTGPIYMSHDDEIAWTILYGTGGGGSGVQILPVNWISTYDSDTYTDTFDITVHETSTESGTAHGNEGGFEGGGSEHGF